MVPPSNEVNWAGKLLLSYSRAAFSASRSPRNAKGFYTVDTLKKDQLILGPFQGKVACQTIPIGRGVCGAAAKQLQTVRVDDVDAFPGHIACDSESRSEIVVPVIATVENGIGGASETKLVAIIDIDCAVLNGFDQVDQTYLERLAALTASSCDWP
ncbi:gaf domain protein nucleotide-binding protein [Grosmannia clavigera kw1407]|uniref:Gaf domain protein nucleotide-binding protein n=1 Tax=Grosmannia clavigera (strain kw1407 / UAMH 11150) TaxID=655863 RepID=F0XSW8_GROCL|nr:gaf domain protein nucleotide-binding protein [Grosmannia clavigera kw1407]EFW99268.1 gaf domain protein nucleotide-binding protein [Grosmannia clavigera kw1407]